MEIHTEESFCSAKNILVERFGNSFNLAIELRNKLYEWQKIPKFDILALQKYSDFLQGCLAKKIYSAELSMLDDPLENEKMSLFW